MFCKFGAGMYHVLLLVTGMQSGRVDSTYIVTDLLLEEQVSLGNSMHRQGTFVTALNTLTVSHIFCLKCTELLKILLTQVQV